MEHILSGIERLMTYAEATAKGIPCDEEPPIENCQFCGKPIKYKGFMQEGKISAFYRMTCRCPEAKAEKEERENKELRGEMLAGMAAQELRNMKAWHDGITNRNKEHSFGNYRCKEEKQTRAKVLASNYANNFKSMSKEKKNSLMFFGGCGAGKTHLACAIANELRRQKVRCKFCTFDDLLLKIKASYNNRDISDEEIREVYKTVELLILDDLGKEVPTEFAVSVLYDIINYRYNNSMPVVITLNHTVKSLVNRLTPDDGDETTAEAIVSRLSEMCATISLDGIEDYRMNN